MELADDLRKIAFILRGMWAVIKDDGYENTANGIIALHRKILEIVSELEGKNIEEE